MFLAATAVQAQTSITIGGNVYGGGNAGETGGSTKVSIYGGTIKGGVFGGAKQANVDGSSFVHIDGEHMSGDIIIKAVYGGNDISGTVGSAADVPNELKTKESTEDTQFRYQKYGVDASYNAFVRTTKERTEPDPDDDTKTKQPFGIFIGSLYGGGNGDYTYTKSGDQWIAQEKQQDGSYKTVATSDEEFKKPVQDKVYLELLGGTIAYAYGGGNNATVERNADIYINNTSAVTTDIQGTDPDDPSQTINLLTSEKWLESMGIASLQENSTSGEYQFNRVFGGNNKADMRIQPTWHLKKGDIRNLYSGGNEGDMTCPTGLLLEIMEGSDVKVDNIFGGCRKANVHPQIWDSKTERYTEDVYVAALNGDDYSFPEGFSARVLVRGGDINNVYGGNDVKGRVYGGNAVGVRTSIRGSIYGGGNGSYPYTDNVNLKNTLKYGDYYYDPDEVLGSSYSGDNDLKSVTALNQLRPDAEQVSIRVKGDDKDLPTIIGGSIYCGGNSATLRQDQARLQLKTNGTAQEKERFKNYPIVELKIGSHVIADEVYLGNNGKEMVRNESATDVLELYKSTVTTKDENNQDVVSNFTSVDLADPEQFAVYMDGVAMDLIPTVTFDKKVKETDEAYIPYSTKIGSFYCGGNVGSMTYPGTNVMDFNVPIYIYDKVVGGCNDAYVPEQYAIDFNTDGTPKTDTDGNIVYTTKKLNAAYEGGIKVALTEAEKAKNPNKLVLNFGGVQLRPERWKTDASGNKIELVWNTVNSNPAGGVPEADGYIPTGEITEYDLTRRFDGGNIYGGCHNSGYVNGNVVINVNSTLVDRDKLFDKVEEDSKGEAILYGEDVLEGITEYNIEDRRTGVILGQQGMDVLGKALNIFGGGKGKNTEIWGSTTINLNHGYVFQVFGGSQEGVIGMPADLADNERDTSKDYVFGDGENVGNGRTYSYSTDYNCYVNLKGTKKGVTKQEDSSEEMAECEIIYGGGFEGPVCGNTIINLGKGRVFNTFAGACNADVLGHTETYIGRQIATDAYSMNMGQYHADDANFIADNADASNQPFPYVRDYIYGGNDLGGEIKGMGDNDFSSRVRSDVKSMTYNYDASKNPKPEQQSASAYIEYRQGRVEGILGGCYGTYDYKEDRFRPYTDANGIALDGIFTKPRMDNAFINFRPLLTDALKNDEYNFVNYIYGSGQGYPGDSDRDIMQSRSYILIDIPQEMNNYKDMEVFGAGTWSGLGMGMKAADAKKPEKLDKVSAIIDLTRGQIKTVYGASYKEGFTRRTVVNVPEGSTISLAKIFGGGYGVKRSQVCDAYESHVNFESELARVSGNIYGGNNNARQTLYTHVNVKKPVYTGAVGEDGTRYMATVYGAGYGFETWANYTEVNLLDGAQVYEVYGGGEMGRVVNVSTSEAMAKMYGGKLDLLPGDYGKEEGLKGHLAVVRPDGKKHNTNVLIHRGAIVHNYAYGGGKGYATADYENGDVNGTTYIALMGGTVKKDIYAAGTIGAVLDKFGTYVDKDENGDDIYKDITDDAGEKFVASTTAYIAGGSVRNVYGGGWKGSVGKHRKLVNKKEADADINDPADNDIPGETYVIIGIRKDQTSTNLENAIKAVLGSDTEQTELDFYCGIPTVQRNAYGGGEGGAVYGATHLTLNNGYIGYDYNTTTGEFEEKLNDETYYEDEKYAGDNRLRDCGNVFGGGYDAHSSVDESNVVMYGGLVRGSIHGGGEIATIGRGTTKESGEANSERVFEKIYKKGKTFVEIFNGQVKRNVYGGGKGYNLLGYGSNSNLFTDGYTFGQTEVQIHGGKIGTENGIADGYGNVFGGGDLGYVYSYGYDSERTKADKAANITTGSPGHYYYYDESGHLTEDCKVVIAPYLQIKEGGTKVDDLDAYDYVTTDYLNTLSKDKNSAAWANLITKDDSGERGVQIYNAVFAGGNVASNSDSHYANATTVFGNTTATIYDVYHRDFVTVGTEHIGGIYGGGNLSMVDGYRELNITNYGTDYYNLQTKITIDQYHNELSDRERAYFKLEYECQETYTGTRNGVAKNYNKGDKISEEDFENLPESEQSHWAQYGFCSIYAGRLLNTIQRADFCGVYGSRMVLQGAKDRVAEVGDNSVYTINRVGELSLNTQNTQAGDTEEKDKQHGNYFGIYSVVNYLGNLTSDVRMKDSYVDKDETTSTTDSYFSYKLDKKEKGSNWPNLGKSKNEVALASGVFLELTTENSTAEKKDYGYITGVVELDLINVKNEELEGGGFVYAKNEHRVAMYYEKKENVILSKYNEGKTGVNEAAKTYKRYRYSDKYDDGPKKGQSNAADWEGAGEGWMINISGKSLAAYQELEMQTSGNFIHAKKHIVDDCYPTNNAYHHVDHADNLSPAHYWYIKGTVYIYDQLVSAYAGSASAYSKKVELPLTITAASHGKLKLLNVKPNLYAYYYKPGEKIGTGENAEDKIVWVNHQTDGYQLNDVITWWDWQNLPDEDKPLFVPSTYVNAEACTIGTKKYAVGEYVMLPDDYDNFLTTPPAIKDYYGENFEDKDGNELTGADLVKYVFRSSNNISHNTGYVLTFDMNTPKVWNTYYTNVDDKNDVITDTEYQALLKAAEAVADPDAAISAIKSKYIEGPTFSHHDSEKNILVLGKRNYTKDDIVTKAVYEAYQATADYKETYMQRAYVATEEASYTYGGVGKTINAGTAIPKSEYDALVAAGAPAASKFKEALVCTNTLKLEEKNYLTVGELKTADEITGIKAIEGKLVTDTEIDNAFTPAYICTVTGEYGGRNYRKDEYYSAIESWCNLSKEDREHLTFNYDALNLLIDPDYSVIPTATTGPHTVEEIYHTPYSDEVGVEYKAVFNGYKDENGNDVTTYNYGAGTVSVGGKIDSDVYETAVPNYKRFYTKVNAAADVDSDTGKFYVATDNFIYNGEPYAEGQIVGKSLFNESTSSTSDIYGKVAEVTPDKTGVFYYCYVEHKEGDTTVGVGKTIDVDAYKNLRDDQKYFTIQGMEPTENTTFFVSRESDVKDVTKEKIITVVYQYTYYETDDDGEADSNDASLKLTNELHVVNVHLQLGSGAPTIGPLDEAPLVFPGDAVGLTPPKVTPGTHEIVTNGWTLFNNKNDADHLRNGVPFNNNSDPVYWYQNQDHYVAFYSETYLGKTYSNYVKLNVANYHDLADIMENHQDNHLFIDRSDVDRPCKIYINDYSGLNDDDARKDKNGLDELKNLFDLSLLRPSDDELDNNGLIKSGPFQGHAPLGNYVNGAAHLEFVLRTDIDGSVPEGSPARTSIAAGTGDTDPCFAGNIHGDGHTISGLTQSLIGKLCGSVYNLGVTGSFTSAGVADAGEGFVENCWISTIGTPDGSVRAVFGNPTASEECQQIVNCYYLDTNNYSTTDANKRGLAHSMPLSSFYNGEVAYNLNGFYLGKRYYDNNTSWKSTVTNKPSYRYLKAEDLTPEADGAASNRLSTSSYPGDFAYYRAEGTDLTPMLGYVESRYFDGDFRYANHTKPESFDVRRRNVVESVTNPVTGEATDVEAIVFPPIWPNDYLFFGQVLNYGYVDNENTPSHQNLPSTISLGTNSNRVFRAPAYFRSNVMKSAYFNTNAVFADRQKLTAAQIAANVTAREAYKGMTAIDFSGGNGDVTGVNNTDYQKGLIPATDKNDAKFFPPLLDDDGLSSFRVEGLTKNLLAYTEAGTITDGVVGAVLFDYAYHETDDTYRTVDTWDEHNLSQMKGHRVQLQSGNYLAPNDHFLVDREDFNAPIGYAFAEGKRMWYQRRPNNYVDLTKGWESISIPFTAELVTTNQKGEITHFYNGNNTDGSSNNVGHEYWLRECTNITNSNSEIATADFTYPLSVETDENEVDNTFLWDYYYKGNHAHLDNNGDTYQDADKLQKYYSVSRSYKGYPLLTNGVPYLIGFPGKTYFEFDLSGEWTAESTGNTAPVKLAKQTITFASATGAEIGVSTLEQEGDGTNPGSAAGPYNGYYFKPNYLNIDVPEDGYIMASDGASYEKVTSATAAANKKLSAFRTYFQADQKVVKAPTRRIRFNNVSSQFGGEDQEQRDHVSESMEFSAKKHAIVVTSHMQNVADVGIYSASGICIGTFDIQPDETIETPIYNSGVYIIRAAGGHYTKKVTIK